MLFCGNDYLGLRLHPAVLGAAHDALALGAGAGSSRLVSGNLEPHERAERALADYVGHDAALLGSSGFAVNIGTLPALTGPGDVIFSDALNHASIVDACRLSRARTIVFPHLDHVALAAALPAARPFRRGWIVTESVFSMDGDLAPLAAYATLAAAAGLHLYVDEAHSLGVIGPDGRGLCAATAVRPDVLVGTLGKALGCAGAFVAGREVLR
ncbi:MAG: aminotransferase class I/II-fold pyridoxal phosphate-dependent enzyme, partial [Deltaproteobacteria bacterium]